MSEVRVWSKVQKNIQQEEGKHSKMSSQNKKVTSKELIPKLEGGGWHYPRWAPPGYGSVSLTSDAKPFLPLPKKEKDEGKDVNQKPGRTSGSSQIPFLPRAEQSKAPSTKLLVLVRALPVRCSCWSRVFQCAKGTLIQAHKHPPHSPITAGIWDEHRHRLCNVSASLALLAGDRSTAELRAPEQFPASAGALGCRQEGKASVKLLFL